MKATTEAGHVAGRVAGPVREAPGMYYFYSYTSGERHSDNYVSGEPIEVR